MQKWRCEDLIRGLRGASSRRGFFGLVFGSGFAAAGAEQVKARKKSCRFLRCTECAPCKKGKCRPKPDGTPCSYMNGQCTGGFCVPPS